MPSLHPGLRHFMSKFACEIVPAGLASLVGAALFAQQWIGPTPAGRAAASADRIVAQNEQIVQMIREEHDVIVDFLKLEREREIAREPLTMREVRAIAEAEHAAKQAAARRAAATPMPVARAKPPEPPIVAAIQSAPLPAPLPLSAAEPRPARGALAAIVETTGGWADKAIAVSHVREAAAAVREIPSWFGSFPGRLIGPSASVEPARLAVR